MTPERSPDPLALLIERVDVCALFWIMAVGGRVALLGVWLVVPAVPGRPPAD